MMRSLIIGVDGAELAMPGTRFSTGRFGGGVVVSKPGAVNVNICLGAKLMVEALAAMACLDGGLEWGG